MLHSQEQAKCPDVASCCTPFALRRLHLSPLVLVGVVLMEAMKLVVVIVIIVVEVLFFWIAI